MGHSAHTGAIVCHIHRLGRRDAPGRHGYALLHHAVIRTEDDNAAGAIDRVQLPADAAQADIDILQRPQAARGLGQGALVYRRPGHGIGIGGRDMGQLL